MVILRPTQKLRSLLPSTGITPGSSDTALGDWYVNRVVVDRQRLLLLVSSTSLLSILLPARDVRCLPNRLDVVVEARLKRCGVRDLVIAAEKRAMTPTAICPTIDRSVLGIMVDFAKSVPYLLEAGPWTQDDLCRVEDLLAKTPCHASRSFERVIFPDKKASELLSSKWLAN
jgi:hypothetical protein